jgi:hypothetical protein
MRATASKECDASTKDVAWAVACIAGFVVAWVVIGLMAWSTYRNGKERK